MGITRDELQIVHLIIYMICPLTVFTNCSLVYFVFHIRAFHKTINYLQTCLAFCEIVCAFLWILGNGYAAEEITCRVLGTIFHFFLVGASCWNFCISVFCYLTIAYKPKIADKYIKAYHCYSWGVSAISTLALFALEAILNRGPIFGDATFECWISAPYADLRIYIYYSLLWIHFAIVLGIYVYIFRKTNMAQKHVESEGIVAVRGVSETGGPELLRKNTFKGIPKSPSTSMHDSGSEPEWPTDQPIPRNNTLRGVITSTTMQDATLECEPQPKLSLSRKSTFKATNPISPTAGNEVAFDNSIDRDSKRITAMKKLITSTSAHNSFSSDIESISQSTPSLAGFRKKPKKYNTKLVWRTCLLAIGFVVSWVPATINRVLNAVEPKAPVPFWLTLWIAIGFAISGLWNPLTFYLVWFWKTKK